MKLSLFCALLSVALVSVLASTDMEAVSKQASSCPCQCRAGFRRPVRRNCRRFALRNCEISDCTVQTGRFFGRRGIQCCDIVPTPTASASPTISASASPSISPSASSTPKLEKPPCPCVCTNRFRARRQCRQFLSYCAVFRCAQGFPGGFPKFECRHK